MEERNVSNKQVTDNLKKGLIFVFFANVINLCISLVNGFILPKYLSMETYADIKTYQLYANYIGIVAFGYSDGLYLYLGGLKMSNIGKDRINIARGNLLLFQGMVTGLGVALSIVISDKILFFTTVCIIPVNIAAAYKNIFQATGEFKTYSKILNYTSILTFAGSMVLLFGFKSDNSVQYISWSVAVTFLIWILMEKKIIIEYGNSFHFKCDFHDLIDNIKSGIVLMLGNFSSIMMTSIDRWFVKVLLTIQDFAYYSFVVSVENLIAIFITPVVTTMYNYICIIPNMASIKRIKKMCLIISAFLISCAFPVKYILEVYLQKYLPSKYILFILFSSEIFYMLIKGIYVNIYKARRQQNIYFIQLIVVIIIGAVLNTVAYIVTRSNEGIAFATLITVILWYIICCFSVKELLPDWMENLYLIIIVPIYIICGFLLPSLLGFLIYLLVALVVSFILMKSIIMDILALVLEMIKEKINY